MAKDLRLVTRSLVGRASDRPWVHVNLNIIARNTFTTMKHVRDNSPRDYPKGGVLTLMISSSSEPAVTVLPVSIATARRYAKRLGFRKPTVYKDGSVRTYVWSFDPL